MYPGERRGVAERVNYHNWRPQRGLPPRTVNRNVDTSGAASCGGGRAPPPCNTRPGPSPSTGAIRRAPSTGGARRSPMTPRPPPSLRPPPGACPASASTPRTPSPRSYPAARAAPVSPRTPTAGDSQTGMRPPSRNPPDRPHPVGKCPASLNKSGKYGNWRPQRGLKSRSVTRNPDGSVVPGKTAPPKGARQCPGTRAQAAPPRPAAATCPATRTPNPNARPRPPTPAAPAQVSPQSVSQQPRTPSPRGACPGARSLRPPQGRPSTSRSPSPSPSPPAQQNRYNRSQMPTANTRLPLITETPPTPPTVSTTIFQQTTTQRFLQPPGRAISPPSGAGARAIQSSIPGRSPRCPAAVTAPPVVAVPVDMQSQSSQSRRRGSLDDMTLDDLDMDEFDELEARIDAQEEATVSVPVASVSGLPPTMREIRVPASIANSPDESIVSVSPATGLAHLVNRSRANNSGGTWGSSTWSNNRAVVPSRPAAPSRAAANPPISNALKQFISTLDEIDRVERKEMGQFVEGIQRTRRNFLFLGMEHSAGMALDSRGYTNDVSRKMLAERLRDENLPSPRLGAKTPKRNVKKPQDYLQGNTFAEEADDDDLMGITVPLYDLDDDDDDGNISEIDLDTSMSNITLYDDDDDEEEDSFNLLSTRPPRDLAELDAFPNDMQFLASMYDPLDFLGPLPQANVVEVQTTTSQTTRTQPATQQDLINLEWEEPYSEQLFRLVKF